jgi:hypothetical protein
MTLASLVVGIIALGVGLYFGIWPRSPGPVTGKPVPTSSGGINPAPLFHGQRAAKVHETQLILFSAEHAIKYGSEQKGEPVVGILGDFKRGSYCAASHALPQTGAYRCVLQAEGINTIADPCFGIDSRQLECQLPDGIFGLVNIRGSIRIKIYHPSLSEVGRQFPFRLELSNGLYCTWNWLPFHGHHGGGWICTKPSAAIEFRPVRGNRFLKGREALRYDGALVTGAQLIYYAQSLAQGSRATWSVLFERPNQPGIFRRVSVAQAWY